MGATGLIEVHTLSAPERRMVLETLASERAGELALHVGHYGRDRVAGSLVELSIAEWVSENTVTLTPWGRHVAEALASRLVPRTHLQLAC